MAREYFCAYHSYLKAMRKLSDAECGRLFRALLLYSAGEQLINLQGREEILFDVFSDQIDRDNAKYESKCEKNRENGMKANGSERPRTVANAPQEKEEEKNKDKGKEEKNKKESVKKKEFSFEDSLLEFSEPMQKVLKEWLQYKKERKESYQPTGLRNCLSAVKNKLAEYPESEVIARIHESMANGWRGIIWDRLKQNSTAQPKRENHATYDLKEFEQWNRERRLKD